MASTSEESGSTKIKSEDEVESLEEARKVIRELRDRQRIQAHQLLAWRRRVKAQEEQIARMNQERNDQLRKLSTQLLLFEARLCRKQREIGVLLARREVVIAKQAETIKRLQGRCGADETNLDSLNDSDSAVIMEDDDPGPGGHGVTVARSISDAVEPPGKYSPLRRSNGLLRRPEVLETVYSVEEDGEGEVSPLGAAEGGGTAAAAAAAAVAELEAERAAIALRARLREAPGTCHGPNHLTTYNRVMSNHRSVTKPKDVKYKRINKAKSKSLEELRGRLKNWVDKGNKIAVSLDQSVS